MKRPPVSRLLAAGAAAALIGSAASAAQKPAPTAVANPWDKGGIAGVWFDAGFVTTRAEQLAKREAQARNNFARKTAEGEAPPLQPWAQQILEQRQKDAREGHPYAHTKSRCLPAGLPMSMDPPTALPLKILVTPGEVNILFEEFSTFRTIYMNQPHQEDPDPSFFGDSIGHWEGDTLVVDTIGLTTQTVVDNAGVPHSDALHVVERFRRSGPNRLELVTTMDDPKAFTKPWSTRMEFASVPNGRLREYYCENERNAPDETGRTGIKMPGATP